MRALGLPGFDHATTRAWNAATLLALSEHIDHVNRRQDVLLIFYGGQREIAKGLRDVQAAIANNDPRIASFDNDLNESGRTVAINLRRAQEQQTVNTAVAEVFNEFWPKLLQERRLRKTVWWNCSPVPNKPPQRRMARTPTR